MELIAGDVEAFHCGFADRDGPAGARERSITVIPQLAVPADESPCRDGLNSLFRRNRFPVRLDREFARNTSARLQKTTSGNTEAAPKEENSLLFTLLSKGQRLAEAILCRRPFKGSLCSSRAAPVPLGRPTPSPDLPRRCPPPAPPPRFTPR
jgi:hypothetical protein